MASTSMVQIIRVNSLLKIEHIFAVWKDIKADIAHQYDYINFMEVLIMCHFIGRINMAS